MRREVKRGRLEITYAAMVLRGVYDELPDVDAFGESTADALQELRRDIDVLDSVIHSVPANVSGEDIGYWLAGKESLFEDHFSSGKLPSAAVMIKAMCHCIESGPYLLLPTRYWNCNGFAGCYVAVVTIKTDGGLIDWTAYIGASDQTGREADTVRWVAGSGAKIGENDAGYLYPLLPIGLFRG